jgi:hypothetical protein
MPPAKRHVPLRLEVRAEAARQIWDRDFDGFTMTTVQFIHQGELLAERRDPFELLFRVTAVGGAVIYEQVGLRLGLGAFRLRVPTCFGPRVRARAWSEPNAGEMHVLVEIALPFLGTIVSYGGLLRPVEA